MLSCDASAVFCNKFCLAGMRTRRHSSNHSDRGECGVPGSTQTHSAGVSSGGPRLSVAWRGKWRRQENLHKRLAVGPVWIP